MPGTPLRKRPQTSKQAKRAYQKSRACPGLSTTDLKRLERGAVLQERADRIKKREVQKTVNRQKRMEKEQKEREARKRMGIPEPKRTYVSPRQERLSQFVRGGGKGREKDAEDTLGEEGEESDETDQTLEDLLVDQSCLVERGSPVRPPRPAKTERPRSQHKRSPYASPLKPASPQADDWAAFFVSNTQIKRELTDDESDTMGEDVESTPGGLGCAIPPEDGTAEFLRHIVTQDLEFDIDEEEEIIPIEETLPMFLSRDAETSGDEQTNRDHAVKVGGQYMAETEDLTSFFATQDLDFSEDELDEWEPSQGYRVRSQPTMAKSGELRSRLTDLQDCQLSGTKTDSGGRKTTTGAEHASAANDDDEEEFAFSSQDLLALEEAAAVQDVAEGSFLSSARIYATSDDFESDSFDIEKCISGEQDFNRDNYLDWLAANYYENEQDYDYDCGDY